MGNSDLTIVIAPDDYKGHFTAVQVAQAIEKGVRSALEMFGIAARIILRPMADGGGGTVSTLVAATNGYEYIRTVMGPLGREHKVTANYGVLGDGTTAVIEMAQASGLALLEQAQRTPITTTTYGTGELIAAALANPKITNIIVGIGGSATNDGGMGMAQALGYKFIDSNGQIITAPGSGGMLKQISRIDASEVHPRIKNGEVTIRAACDVSNPLCGIHGASFVYGPQKCSERPADPESDPRLIELDQGLRSFAAIIERDLGKKVLDLAGSGAAGGIGAGLVAFTNASLEPGVNLIIDAIKLREDLQGADIVITGEGQTSWQQTGLGFKCPVGVATAAREVGARFVACISGGLAEDATRLMQENPQSGPQRNPPFHAMMSVTTDIQTLDEVMTEGPKALEKAAERLVISLVNAQRLAGRFVPSGRS